jgi:serine/threonine protein kinase
MGIKLPQLHGSRLASLLPTASEDAIDFISRLLTMDPNRRPSAKNALCLPFLQGEQMTLSDLEARAASRRARRPLPSVSIAPRQELILDRPRAAPIMLSPRNHLRRSWSQENLAQIGQALKQIDLSKPIDYRMFEAVGAPSDDDIFDDIF